MALDFPASPSLGQTYLNYTWDGEKWTATGDAAQGAVRYDIAQGLTAAQQAQGRANIDVTKKNYIINGAMQVSQENGNTAGTTSGYYPVDMFQVATSAGGAYSAQWVGGLPTPGGAQNRIRFTVTTADAAVAAGDVVYMYTVIEGVRMSELRAGSAAAKTVTLRFGVKAPAGTYSVVFANSTRTRSENYVISAAEANTDVVKTITIPLDTSGTWAIDNMLGMMVFWSFMCGTTWASAPGSWSTFIARGSTSQFNFMGTAGNIFELFDVGLYEGPVAPPYQVPDYASELQLCRRYYQNDQFGNAFTSPLDMTQVYRSLTIPFVPAMRASPTVVVNALATGSWSAGFPTYQLSPNFFIMRGDVTPAASSYSYITGIKANARI